MLNLLKNRILNGHYFCDRGLIQINVSWLPSNIHLSSVLSLSFRATHFLWNYFWVTIFFRCSVALLICLKNLFNLKESCVLSCRWTRSTSKGQSLTKEPIQIIVLCKCSVNNYLHHFISHFLFPLLFFF